MSKRRSFTLLLVFLMLFMMVSPAFAEEGEGVNLEDIVDNPVSDDNGSGNGGNEDDDSFEGIPDDPEYIEPGEDEQTPPDSVRDDTQGVKKDNIYVYVYYEEEVGTPSYIPKFELVLRDGNGNVISTVVADKKNYNAEEGRYELAFPNKGYKLGDKFQIYLSKADSLVKSVTFTEQYFNGDDLVTNETILNVGNYFPFEVRADEVYEGENDSTLVKVLVPSKLMPLQASLETDNTKFGIYLETESGVPLANASATLEFRNGKKMDVKSNSDGLIILNPKSIDWDMLIYVKDRYVKDSENGVGRVMLPFGYTPGAQTTFVSRKVIVSDDVQNGTLGVVGVNVKIDGSTEISQNWTEFNLTLVKDKNTSYGPFKFNHIGQKISGIPDGKYTVKFESDSAELKSGNKSVVVTGGKGNIDLVIKPKYVLVVDKDGKNYNFSFLNVKGLEDKKFTGKKEVKFAVAPGESYMIRDNDTGEVITVSISANSPITKVVLGAGVVFGGKATSPHTGDSILFLLAMFGISVLVAVLSLIYYRKGRKIKTSVSTVCLLLAFVLVGQILFPAFASADIGSGTPGKGGGGSTTPVGLIQTSSALSIFSIGFLPAEGTGGGRLKNDSDIDDMEKGYQFSETSMRYMFYMATEPESAKVLRNKNTALIGFNYDKGQLFLRKGLDNPLVKSSKPAGSTASRKEFEKFILPEAETIIAKGFISGQTNYFDWFVGHMVKSMSDTATKRHLWAKGGGRDSNSEKNFGDIVNRYFIDTIGSSILRDEDRQYLYSLLDDYEKGIINSKDKDWIKKYQDFLKNHGDAYRAQVFSDALAGLIMNQVFDGYVEKLRKLGYSDEADKLHRLYYEGEPGDVVLFAQVIQGFYVNGQKSKYALMPFHEAAQWYKWGRGKERPDLYGSINKNHEAKIVYWHPNDKGGSSSSKWAKVSPTFTFMGNVRNKTAMAAKPRSSKVPIISQDTNSRSSLNKNPFAGWGFIPWGTEARDPNNAPKLEVILDVTAQDENGNIERFQKYLEGYEPEKTPIMEAFKSGSISGSMVIKHNDNLYEIQPNDRAEMTLVDKKDKEDILSIDGVLRQPYISVPSLSDSSRWVVRSVWDVPKAEDLHSYLGGTVKGAVRVKSKYPEGQFSHAVLTIKLEAKKLNISNTANLGVIVPQWRWSKYWDMLPTTAKKYATFELIPPSPTTFRNAYTTPTGNISFRLIDPDLRNVLWAYSKTKLLPGETNTKYISAYNRLATFGLTGDLLAVRAIPSIDNIYISEWKNPMTLFDGRIISAIKGAGSVSSPEKKVFHTFKYGVNSGHDPFKWTEDRQVCHSDSDGNVHCSWKPWTRNATSVYKTADYDVGVTFKRYIPKASKPVKEFDPEKEAINGKYWETWQSDKVLNVNPEVLMAYDDNRGNTSVAFAAGDLMRQIKPVHYGLARYVNLDIKPDATGTSVATDSKAKQLAARLGAGGKEVIYKGSGLLGSFEVKGELELKTFAVDIGPTSLKNSWNPNTTYNTDKVNEDFLSKFGTKGSDGKWRVNLGVAARMVIGSSEYGGQKGQIMLTQKGNTSVTTHMLEIRGGKLVGVNGSRDLTQLPAHLKEALERMKISVSDNIFNTFERMQGDALTEPTVAYLGNALRGTSDLAVGRGWYNEDTTVLVVREYTTVFDLPNYQFSDKVPMDLGSYLAVPVDKNQFFSKGLTGHLKLSFNVDKMKDAYLISDASKGELGVKKSIQFVVPNVSVTDTFTIQ